jgi:hypothetical protein
MGKLSVTVHCSVSFAPETTERIWTKFGFMAITKVVRSNFPLIGRIQRHYNV